MLKFRKVFNTEIISIFVALTFLLHPTVYAIDLSKKALLRTPLMGNSKDGQGRLKQALLYASLGIGDVVRAENDADVNLLGVQRRALLLPDGNILLTQELYKEYSQNNPEAIQAIVHEIAEALFQVIRETQPNRYQSIKELALNNLVSLYFNTDRSDKGYRDEVLANDIWAVILEHRLMGIELESVENKELRNLLKIGYDIIDKNGLLCGEEFNSLHRIRETVVDWLRRGGTFSKAANEQKEHSQDEAVSDRSSGGGNLPEEVVLTGSLNSTDAFGFSAPEKTIRKLLLANRDKIHQMPFRQSALMSTQLSPGTYSYTSVFKALFPHFQSWLLCMKRILEGISVEEAYRFIAPEMSFKAPFCTPVRHIIFFELPERGLVDSDTGVYVREASLWHPSTQTLYVCVTPQNILGICKELMRNLLIKDGIVSRLSYPRPLTPLINTLSDIAVSGLHGAKEMIPEHIADAVRSADIDRLLEIRTQLLSFGRRYSTSDLVRERILDAYIEEHSANKQYASIGKYIYELLGIIDKRLREMSEFEQLSRPDRITTAREVREYVLSPSKNEERAWQALMDLAPLDCQRHIVLLEMAVHVIKANIAYSVNINIANWFLLEDVSKNAEVILHELREIDRKDGELAAFCRFLVHRTLSSDYELLYGTWVNPKAEAVKEPIEGFKEVMRPWTELQRLLRIPPRVAGQEHRTPSSLGDMRTALIDYYIGLGIQYAPPINLADPRFPDAFVRSTDPVLLYLLLRYGIPAEALQLFTVQPCHRRGDSYPFFEMAGREMVDTKPIDIAAVLRDKIRFATQVCGMELGKLHITLIDPNEIPVEFKDVPEFIERYNHNKIYQALLDLGIRPENVHLVGAEENWWNQGGVGIPDTAGQGTRGWLYGPSIEVFFDIGVEYGCQTIECQPGCKKCRRFIEWGNTLTMTAIKVETSDGKTYYQWLHPNFYMAEDVMGLERLVMAVKNLGSEYDVYEAERFCTSIRSTIPAYIRREVPEQELNYSVRAIAGCLKSLLFLIADGAHRLGIEQRKSYIKTTARDVLTQMASLGIDRRWLPLLLDELGSYYRISYPHLAHAVEDVCRLLEERSVSISANLKRCIKGSRTEPGLIQLLRDNPDYELSEEDIERFDRWGSPLPWIRRAAMLLRMIVKNNCVIHPEDMRAMAWVLRIPEHDLKSMLMQPHPTGLGLKIKPETPLILTPIIINPEPEWVRIRAFSYQFGQLSPQDVVAFIKTAIGKAHATLDTGRSHPVIYIVDRARNLPISDGINTWIERDPWVDEYGRSQIGASLEALFDLLPEYRRVDSIRVFLVSDARQEDASGWLREDLADLFGAELCIKKIDIELLTYGSFAPDPPPQLLTILIGPTLDVALMASAIRRNHPYADILVGPCFEPDLTAHMVGMQYLARIGCRFWQGPPKGEIVTTRLKTIDSCFGEGDSTTPGIGRGLALYALGTIIALGQNTLRYGPPVILESGSGIIEPNEVGGLPGVVSSEARILSVDRDPAVVGDLRWMQLHRGTGITSIFERSSSRIVGAGGVRIRPEMWKRLGIEGLELTPDKILSVSPNISTRYFVEDASDIVVYLPSVGSHSISQVILGNLLNNLPYQPGIDLSTMQFVYRELERILQAYGVVTYSTNVCFLYCPIDDKRGVFAPLIKAGLCPLYMAAVYANISEGAIMENLEVVAARPQEYSAFPGAEEAVAIARAQLDKTLPEDLKSKVKEREKVTLDQIQEILGTKDGSLEENLINGKETLLFLVKTGDNEYFMLTIEGSYYEVFKRLATYGDGFYPDITEELGIKLIQRENELNAKAQREKMEALRRAAEGGFITVEHLFTGFSTVAAPGRNPDFWRLALEIADRLMEGLKGDVLMPASGPYDLWTVRELTDQISQDVSVVGIDWNAVITAINMMIQRRAIQGEGGVPLEYIGPHTGTVTIEEPWVDEGRQVLNNAGVQRVRLERHNLIVPKDIAERVIVLPAQDFFNWLSEGQLRQQHGLCLAGNLENNALFQYGMTFEKLLLHHRNLLKALIPGGIYAFTTNAIFWNDTRQNHSWNLGQVLDESGWEVLAAITQHAEILDEKIIGENMAVLACEKGRYESFPDAKRVVQIVEEILKRYEREGLDVIKRSGTYEEFRKSIESGNEANIIMIKTGVDTVWYVNLQGDYKTAFTKLVSLEDGKGFHPDIIAALSKEIATLHGQGQFALQMHSNEESFPAPALKMEDVRVLSASSIIEENSKREYNWFPTDLDANERAVVIAMSVDEYDSVKYLNGFQDRVYVQVVNVSGEDARGFRLKPYQILTLDEAQAAALLGAILPNGLEGVTLDVMQGINETTRETIWGNI